MNFSKSKWKKQDFGYSFGKYEIRKGESWKVYFMGDFVGESETLKDAKLVVQDHWDSQQPLESVEITGIVSAEIVGEKIHIQLKSCEIIIDKSRANREVKEWLDSPKCDCCGKLEVEIECPKYEEKKFVRQHFNPIGQQTGAIEIEKERIVSSQLSREIVYEIRRQNTRA